MARKEVDMGKFDWAEDWKLQFIDRIGDDKRSMRSVASDKDMPAYNTIVAEFESDQGFLMQYTRAKERRAEGIFEEILDIADDGTNDWTERRREDGSVDEVLNHEHIQRSRVRIDARKWMLGKMQPKKYGDKIGLDVDGNLTLNLIDSFKDDKDKA